MAITGAHMLFYTSEPEALRATLADVFEWPSVDAGHGWLIFALPPAEVAVHPSEHGDTHELYFMCDDVHAFIHEMTTKNVPCSPVTEERWGSLTRITLPGGGTIGVYQPKHPSPVIKAESRPA